MKAETEKKIKGGKLLQVELEYGDRIENVIITGDFFLHPEEGIFALENSLVGLERSARHAQIKSRLDDVIAREGLQIIGFTPEDLSRLIEGVLK